mmetsp:Transcript_14744/g.28141  ORF Transcript_14744/g.28141 Transcript_14744/m.28141 type:complete len:83 (-) Transcript_14744:117-365(-)
MSDPWSCEKCTYFHQYSAQRCVMCNSLRVSKQQMRDFISGRSKSSRSNSSSSGSGQGSTDRSNNQSRNGGHRASKNNIRGNR